MNTSLIIDAIISHVRIQKRYKERVVYMILLFLPNRQKTCAEAAGFCLLCSIISFLQIKRAVGNAFLTMTADYRSAGLYIIISIRNPLAEKICS